MKNVIIGNSDIAYACASRHARFDEAVLITNTQASRMNHINALRDGKVRAIIVDDLDSNKSLDAAWKALNINEPWSLLLTHRYALHNSSKMIRDMVQRNVVTTQALVEGALRQKRRPERIVITCGMNGELDPGVPETSTSNETAHWCVKYAAKKGATLAFLGDRLLEGQELHFLTVTFITLAISAHFSEDAAPFIHGFRTLAFTSHKQAYDKVLEYLGQGNVYRDYSQLYTEVSKLLAPHKRTLSKYFLETGFLMTLDAIADRLLGILSADMPTQGSVRLYSQTDDLSALSLQVNQTFISVLMASSAQN